MSDNCKVHRKNPVLRFCHDCKISACSECDFVEHRGHKICEDLVGTAEKFFQRMRDDFAKISMCVLQCEDELSLLETDHNNFVEKVTTIQLEIKRKYDQLRQSLELHQRQLTEELTEIVTRRIEEMEDRLDEVQNHKDDMVGFQARCNKVNESGSMLNVVRKGGGLHGTAKKLVARQEQYNSTQHSRVDLKFIQRDVGGTGNFIGDLEFKEFKSTAAAFLSSPYVIALLEETGCVCGVTVLGKELFILRYHQPKIKVYDSENYRFKRDLVVPNLMDPCDLVSCSFHNRLYISEPSYKYIHCVDLSSTGNNSTSIMRWAVNEVWTRLSVSRDHNVVITVGDVRRIQEYDCSDRSSKGRIVRKREVRLEEALYNPRHAIQLSSEHYVVAHHEYDSEHRVCVVDAKGRTIQSFGSLPGSGDRQLNTPACLAVDKHDYVFVADSENDRIRVLSPTLGFLGDIRIPGYVLSRPITLHFDEINNRLYIGEDTGQRLFVLSADVAVTPKINTDIRLHPAINGIPGGKITEV